MPSTTSGVGATPASDVLERQAALQGEADQIVATLGLEKLLRAAGDPVRVGSSALGLMVRRDIDITVVCERLDPTTHRVIAGIAGELIVEGRVGALRYRNDSGPWNAISQAYPDGLYLGVTYRSLSDEEWTFDIWFVDEPERQPDLKHLTTLPPRLSEDVRNTIVTIKTELASNQAGTKPAPSALVYDAVLDHGVRTAAEFRTWLSKEQR